MPRENNPNFLLKIHKLPAKIADLLPLQTSPVEFTLPLAKPNPATTPPPQFHQEPVPVQAPSTPNPKNGDWCEEDDLRLYELHNQLGNKWSLMSRSFPGKSDNCVKNHFFSRLRMSLRHLNKHLRPDSPAKPAKMHVIYKIISTCEERFNADSEYTQSFIDFSFQLKNKILHFLSEKDAPTLPVEETLEQIHLFNKQYKMRADVLKIPKSNKIKSAKKGRESDDDEQSILELLEDLHPLGLSIIESTANQGGEGRVFQQQQGKLTGREQVWNSLETILQESSRLSQLFSSEPERLEIKMIDTSDYLFNDENHLTDFWSNPMNQLPQFIEFQKVLFS